MLVLSRKEGEKLIIGDDVVITINRISGNRVTLGIEAPREVRIVRGELDPGESRPESSGKGNASLPKSNGRPQHGGHNQCSEKGSKPSVPLSSEFTSYSRALTQS